MSGGVNAAATAMLDQNSGTQTTTAIQGQLTGRSNAVSWCTATNLCAVVTHDQIWMIDMQPLVDGAFREPVEEKIEK